MISTFFDNVSKARFGARRYEEGMSTHDLEAIIPEIFVHDGAAALDFYARAFGAVIESRIVAPDGKRIAHSEIRIGGHRLFVCDEFDAKEGGTCKSPRTLGGTGVRISVMVADADAAVAKAVAAGARVLLPVADQYWGGRYGKIVDPFGHEWGVNQQKVALTSAEEEAAAKEHFAKT